MKALGANLGMVGVKFVIFGTFGTFDTFETLCDVVCLISARAAVRLRFSIARNAPFTYSQYPQN